MFQNCSFKQTYREDKSHEGRDGYKYFTNFVMIINVFVRTVIGIKFQRMTI